MDILDPFMTVFREHPDFDAGDARLESQQLGQRQDVIEQVMQGGESFDTLLDLLESQGIDPAEYINATAQNLDYIVDNGIRFTSNDAGILLPEFLI